MEDCSNKVGPLGYNPYKWPQINKNSLGNKFHPIIGTPMSLHLANDHRGPHLESLLTSLVFPGNNPLVPLTHHRYAWHVSLLTTTAPQQPADVSQIRSKILDICEQPPLFGKERNSLWMETFFFQIHLAYGNEVGGN